MNEAAFAEDDRAHRSAAPRAARAWQHPAQLVGIGGLALALGLLVYLADRDTARALLIPAVGALAGSHVFGAIGLWLPSFVHPFAFSLFTAAALPPRPTPRYGACASWGAINVAFEIGQHPQWRGLIADGLGACCGETPPTRWLAAYFMRGTFDVLDIVAATAGALAAAIVLRRMHRYPESPDG